MDLSDLPPMLGITDVARMLGVSADTVSRWVASGRLPAPYPLRRNFHAWPSGVILPVVEELLAGQQEGER